jgi:hypothetical protein
MRARTSLAAFGIALSLSLSIVLAVPAFYNAFPRMGLARLLLIAGPILVQAAILVFLVSFWLALAGLRKAAIAAAILVAVQLACDFLTVPGFMPQVERLLWLFGGTLGDFAWLVLLVLFAREAKPLEQRETRVAALLVAATTILNAAGLVYSLFSHPRWLAGDIFWLFPTGQFWSRIALALVVAIQLTGATCLVIFLLGIARNWPPARSGIFPLDSHRGLQ